jgi:hypothetical protein
MVDGSDYLEDESTTFSETNSDDDSNLCKRIINNINEL